MGKYKARNVEFKTWMKTISMIYHPSLYQCVEKCGEKNSDIPPVVEICSGILSEGKDWVDSAHAITSAHEGACIMFFCEKSTEQDVVHECLHATAMSLRGKGMYLTAESEEAYCYFIGHLAKKALKFVKKSRE